MIDKSLLLEHQRMDSYVPISYNNIYDLLLKKVEKSPDKTFLICPGKITDRFTYSEFLTIIKKIMSYLKRLNLKQNDRICLVFHNSTEFITLYFAGLALGLTIVPINPDITSREMAYIIKDSNSSFVFFDEKLKVKILEINDDLDKVNFKKITTISEINDSIEEFDTKVILNNLAVIIYTSGTTGDPKGVKLTHLNLLADAHAISNWFQFNQDTRTLCILPLFHNNGQITTLLAPLYTGGSTIIIKGKVSLYSFWEIVHEFHATWTSMMASILSILLSLPKERKEHTLKAILCGGQVLTQTVQSDFEERFNVPIFEGYGLTETTSFSCINDYPAENRKYGSIGKPLSTNEMEIFDDDNQKVEANTEGEICIRGLNVSEGYLGLNEINKKSFRDGWFHSNDFGRKDEDGYFYIHGRRDSLIIKGGENIYPAEIENILYQHPDINECAVIGIPDKLFGEEICAFIKIIENKLTTEDELKEFCKGKIAAFKLPKKIIIVNNLKKLQDIPKGPTKKILYKDLKKYYLENVN